MLKESKIELDSQEIEGYEVCKTKLTRCLKDCLWPLDPPVFSKGD